VYGLCSSQDPSVIRYIGITKHDDPRDRLRGHYKLAKKEVNRPVYDWMRKHIDSGSEIYAVVFLSHITIDKAKQKEIELIAHYRATGNSLMNMTAGGEGTVGVRPSEETSRKRSESLKRFYAENPAPKGRKLSLEHRNKISEGNKGVKRPKSEEHRKKISDAKTGYKHNEQQRQNMSKSRADWWASPAGEEAKRKRTAARIARAERTI
jgi:hypothetical protein